MLIFPKCNAFSFLHKIFFFFIFLHIIFFSKCIKFVVISVPIMHCLVSIFFKIWFSGTINLFRFFTSSACLCICIDERHVYTVHSLTLFSHIRSGVFTWVQVQFHGLMFIYTELHLHLFNCWSHMKKTHQQLRIVLNIYDFSIISVILVCIPGL